MSDEQQRTLDYYEERYERMVMLQARGQIKTTADYVALNQARADYYGYWKWLDAHVMHRKAA